MTIDPAGLTERFRGTLAELLGIRFVEASVDRVVAELPVRDALRTVGGAVHGGTLMALADTVGAAATVLGLPPGATTATLESRMYEGISERKRSWPAVSQSCRRTVRSSRYMVLLRKSMPIVAW